jgi:predicted PurR-regulated permease PerM
VKLHRIWRRGTARTAPAAPAGPEPQVIQFDQDQLREMSAMFAAPRWLRDLGIASWLVVGVAALLVGLTWLLGIMDTIVGPVLVGLILATVCTPGVSWLARHRVPRAAGAALVLLVILAVGVVIIMLVVSGLVGQKDSITTAVNNAVDKLQGWAQDAGVDASGASSANKNVSQAVPDILSTLVNGVAHGIQGLTSLAFGISFSIFSIFFLLKDGPALRGFVERHMGAPLPVARTITGGVISSMRRYFLGVTIVGAFNAAVVGIGAIVLGVPLAGTIAVVTFVLAYIPFIGAFVAGAFAVLIALGAQGTGAAVAMLVIVILANGALQNIVQPIAMGATLRMNPLLILVVTVGAGALFGMVGMVLAAPLTASAIHISADLASARAAAKTDVTPEPEPPPDTAAEATWFS